jgi:hypothetical protein
VLDGTVEAAIDDLPRTFITKKEGSNAKATPWKDTKKQKGFQQDVESLFYCGGSDETRTRDLLRDRQAF